MIPVIFQNFSKRIRKIAIKIGENCRILKIFKLPKFCSGNFRKHHRFLKNFFNIFCDCSKKKPHRTGKSSKKFQNDFDNCCYSCKKLHLQKIFSEFPKYFKELIQKLAK